MRTVTWLGGVALGLVLTGAASAENIKIGFMVPYSGANADLGAVQDKAIDLYMKLHAKDILPHTVEIIKRDEGPPSGANAKTVATELITRDKVNLLLGIVFSPSAIAMAPVVTQAKVPFMIASLIGHFESSAFKPSTTTFQTIHHCSVDVARGLVLLFGIGTTALPLWDSRTRRNNLMGGLTVRLTAGPSDHTNSPHPSSREGHLSTA